MGIMVLCVGGGESRGRRSAGAARRDARGVAEEPVKGPDIHFQPLHCPHVFECLEKYTSCRALLASCQIPRPLGQLGFKSHVGHRTCRRSAKAKETTIWHRIWGSTSSYWKAKRRACGVSAWSAAQRVHWIQTGDVVSPVCWLSLQS